MVASDEVLKLLVLNSALHRIVVMLKSRTRFVNVNTPIPLAIGLNSDSALIALKSSMKEPLTIHWIATILLVLDRQVNSAFPPTCETSILGGKTFTIEERDRSIQTSYIPTPHTGKKHSLTLSKPNSW